MTTSSSFSQGPPVGRVGLFGDSIAMGLGVRNKKYGELVADALAMNLVDYSHTGWTVQQSLSEFIRNPARLDVAIIAHGVTEPIHRPRIPRWLPIPARWRRLGWMDPRPYYSSRLWKRVLERLESELRWRIKNALIRAFGSYQLSSVEAYEVSLRELVALCRQRGALVVVLGPPDIDERYFPGSNHSQLRYSRVAETIAGEGYQPLAGVMPRWDGYLLDHFHPNDFGHEAIGVLVTSRIRRLRREDSATRATSKSQ